jgi:hypothetical protein
VRAQTDLRRSGSYEADDVESPAEGGTPDAGLVENVDFYIRPRRGLLEMPPTVLETQYTSFGYEGYGLTEGLAHLTVEADMANLVDKLGNAPGREDSETATANLDL